MRKNLVITIPQNNLHKREKLPAIVLKQSDTLILDINLYQDEYKVYPWDLTGLDCYLVIKENIFSTTATALLTNTELYIDYNTVSVIIDSSHFQLRKKYIASFIFECYNNKYEKYLFQLKVVD